MKENYPNYLPYQFHWTPQSVDWEPQLPNKKMKTLFLWNMSKSRRLTLIFFPDNSLSLWQLIHGISSFCLQGRNTPKLFGSISQPLTSAAWRTRIGSCPMKWFSQSGRHLRLTLPTIGIGIIRFAGFPFQWGVIYALGQTSLKARYTANLLACWLETVTGSRSRRLRKQKKRE